MKYHEMKVAAIVLDPSNYVPMVILKDMNEENSLPVWIGITEAAAILTELEKVDIERPMTHDLTKKIIGSLGGDVFKVTIDDIKDNVFYSTIYIKTSSGEILKMDSRPSDAIAMAMSSSVPILVNEKVILKSKVIDISTEQIKGRSKEELLSILENLSTDDFGKYMM